MSMGSIRSKAGSSMLFFSMGLIYGCYELASRLLCWFFYQIYFI